MNILVPQSHQSGLNGATIPFRESQQKYYAANTYAVEAHVKSIVE